MDIKDYIKACVLSKFHKDKYTGKEKGLPISEYMKSHSGSLKEMHEFFKKYGDFIVDLTNYHLKLKIEDNKFRKLESPIQGLYLGRDCFVDAMKQIKEECEVAEAIAKRPKKI